MKKLITLLATATLAVSTVAFADDATKTNDALSAAPAAGSPTVVADASGTEGMAASDTSTAKPAKKHHHKHHAKKHHKKKAQSTDTTAAPAAADQSATPAQ